MNKVAENTGWQLAARVVAITSSLVATPLLTRLLSQEAYGNYIFLTSIVLLFLNFSDMGMGFWGVKIASETKNKDRTLSNIFNLKFLLTFAVWFVFIILALLFPQFSDTRKVSLIASLALIFLSLRMLADIILKTELNFFVKSLWEITGSLFFLLTVALLYLNQTSSLGLVITMWALSAILSGTGAFLAVRRKIKLSKPKPQNIKDILHKSAPIGIRQLIFATYDQGIDNFLLKSLTTAANVGYYGLSYKVYSNLASTASFLMNSIFPQMSASDNKKTYFKKSLLILSASGLILSLAAYFFSPFIIQVLAGSSYSPSISILKILSLAIVFSFINHATGYTLIALGQQGRFLRFSLIALGINIAGNITLIPVLGGIGAAATTLTTEVSMLVMSFYALKKVWG
jgi:O-antigen/teichoic acid export membrane protein